MNRTLACTVLVLAGLVAVQATEPDPWIGKSRSDLLLLLGEPNKSKPAGDGTLLTYKLARLDEGAIPPVGMRVLSFPGVRGTVGTMTPPGTLDGDEVTIGPTEFDKRGRSTGGGVESDESYSVSWSKKEGRQQSWEDRSAIRGKLTLKFQIDAVGTIESWSVSPKKARAEPEEPVDTSEKNDTPARPTVEQLANLTYYDIIPAVPVELTDGHWDGSPSKQVELIRDPVGFGDFNRDGNEDAAVLLAESSGGSPTRIWLSTVGVVLDRPVCFGSAQVGDRAQIRSMQVDEQGWIELEMVDEGPRDPACCPTKLWTKSWALVDGKLTQVAAVMGESLSTELFAGRDWTLTHFDRDEPAPASPRITARFEPGKLTGSSGCNTYFAEITGRQPGVLAFGEVGSTLRACSPEVMAVEQKYLTRLGLVTRYGFWMGRLALEWQDGKRTGTMLFGSVQLGAPGGTR